MKKPTVTYLYADGHAVIVYEKQDKDAGTIQFCEIVERFTEARLSFKGRIIFSRFAGALAQLCKAAIRIEAEMPTIERGSEASRAKGIHYGSLIVDTKHGHLYFHDMPGTISGQYTYQDNVVETFDAGAARWSGMAVGAIHRVKADKVLAVA